MPSSAPRLHEEAIVNARVLDVFTGDLSPKTVLVDGGRISGFARRRQPTPRPQRSLTPEAACCFRASSTRTSISRAPCSRPAGFAALVLPFGTTTVIADPHEMANVAGLKAHGGPDRSLQGAATFGQDHGAFVRPGAPL